jgi:5,10-methylenetetrahydromethanopterin reductase
MQIDIALEPGNTPDEVAELGLLAERHGIGTLWITNDPTGRDVFLCLAALARTSRRIRVGVMAISPFEMHPLKMANSLLTLNELAGGRASLLVGGGGAFLGNTRFQPQRRVSAVAECIDILKQASAGTPLNYAGEIYTVRNYRPEWAVPEAPRILAGANKPQMLRMAARAADGVLMSDMPLPLCPPAIRVVADSLAANGRATKGFEFNNYWAWHVRADRQSAVNEARSRLALRGMLKRTYIEPFLSDADCALVVSHMPAFYKAFASGSPVIEGVPDRVIDALINHLTLTAGAADLDSRIEELGKFAAAGLTHVTLGLHDDPAAAIRTIGERVVPLLRSL